MPQPPKRLLLIHGAWVGAWVWDGLIGPLAARGITAEALDLPGDGFHPIPPEEATPDDFLDCIRDAIHAGRGPVGLVGHSGGGMLVTAAAEAFPELVTHGIWIAGMLIADGRSFDDIQDDCLGKGNRFGVTPHVRFSEDGRVSTVPPEAALKYFFHDVQGDLAHAAAARLTPQPAAGRRMSTPTGPNFAALRKLYILAERDRSVVPQAQEAMAASAGNITIHRMDAGHAPQLTCPENVAGVIAYWIAVNAALPSGS